MLNFLENGSTRAFFSDPDSLSAPPPKWTRKLVPCENSRNIGFDTMSLFDVFYFFRHGRTLLDERQITHLICARLKYDLYDFLRGCFGPFIQEKERKQAQNTPKKVI